MTLDPPKQDQIETVRVLPVRMEPGKVAGDEGTLLHMSVSVLVPVSVAVLVLASVLMVLMSAALVVLLTFDSVSVLVVEVTFVLVLFTMWVVSVLPEMLLLLKMFVWLEVLDLESKLLLLRALLCADAEAVPLDADAVLL